MSLGHPRIVAALGFALAMAPNAGCAHRQELEPAPWPEPGDEAGQDTSGERAGGHGALLQVGYASWYGAGLAGHRTANGERFDPRQMTAAHRSLPFGTWVEVRRVETGDTVRVRITDRGPFGHDERIIDLSREAAKRLGMLRIGIARVELRMVAGP